MQVVSSRFCRYDAKRRVLSLDSSYFGMPITFMVESSKTGKRVRFIPVGPADILFDQDGWDGEQQLYRPCENIAGIDYMVIHNS
jgi:hypothetical protein